MKKKIVCSFFILGTSLSTIVIPLPASADLMYEGSSTIGESVLPYMTMAFEKKTGVKFSRIGLAGSGMGIRSLIDDKADIAGVSRSLTREEKDQKFYYLIIGYDVIAIFVNKKNPVKNLTHAEVRGIFTGRIKTWKELGGESAPIIAVTEVKGGKRATMEEFKHLVLGKTEDYGSTREIDKPADCVKYVATDVNAITFASMTFSLEGVKLVNFGGLEPKWNDVVSGAYPLSRPLILIAKKYPQGEIKKFFDFIISPEGQKIIGAKILTIKKSD